MNSKGVSKILEKGGFAASAPTRTRVATPKIGVDNQGRVWYKIDESKPLPVLARGCSHFLYLKTATIVSLAIRIKSTDEGNPLLSLSSKHFFTSPSEQRCEIRLYRLARRIYNSNRQPVGE